MQELVAIDASGELESIDKARQFRVTCLAEVNVKGALDAERYCAALAEMRAKEAGMTDWANRWAQEACEFAAAVGEMLGKPQHGGDRKSEEFQELSGILEIPRGSVSGYRALNAVEPAEREAYYEKCRESGDTISKSGLRRVGLARTRKQDRAERDERLSAELPEGEYSLIYCDPPWRYEHVKTESRAIENQYPTMSLEEIQALPAPAADDCVLFMWATSPKLHEAMSVIDAWDFTYRTCAVWVKDRIGMGYYFRQRHELLLVATKGAPGAPASESSRHDSVIEAPRQRHSAKPVVVYDILEAMYPHARRVELFARAPRLGWAAWGNQSSGT